MITYSRALRLGDFVRIGEVEGTVNHVGVLSTKIKTLRGEQVTIPNAVVVGTTTTNYSRFADVDGGLHADERDHRLRHAVAPGAVAPAHGRGPDARTSAQPRRRSCARSNCRTST